MSGNLPPGVTQNDIDRVFSASEEDERAMEQDRDDAIDALQQAGMEPMSAAPRNKEIVVVLDDDKLTRERVYWQDCFWPIDDRTGAWWAANGDGAPDSPPWPHWQDDELIGWLPAGEV